MVIHSSLLNGSTQSCGCYHRERQRDLPTTHGHTKGGQRTAEYRIWVHIKSRCYNPKVTAYKDYGGRGIMMCDRWKVSFEAFLADVGPRPSLKHSLDRYPDMNGNYEPGNVRWATAKEQNNNRRDNSRHSHDGRTQTISEWADEAGMNYRLLASRLRSGWDFVRAISEPAEHNAVVLTAFGRSQRICDWARELGVSDHLIITRRARGWSAEKALGEPKRVQETETVEYRGKTVAIADLAREHGVDRLLFYKRIKRGWDVERALTEPTSTLRHKKRGQPPP